MSFCYRYSGGYNSAVLSVRAGQSRDADRLGELVAEGVGERGVPLIREAGRRRHDERADAGVGDGLQPEERLPAARGEHDTPRRSWAIQASSAACWSRAVRCGALA